MAALKIYSHGSQRTSIMERFPVTNSEAVVIGEAVVLTTGAFTKCAADARPTHIMHEAGTGDGTTLMCALRLTEDDVIETTVYFSGGSAPVVGTKVTLHTDGLQVTNTTSSGVFELCYVGGTTTGSTVRGRFS